MSNNFCRYLANQKRFVYGQIQPCCWFAKSADLSDPEEVKKYQNWLYSINDWVPECNFCYSREKNNMYSPRLESLQFISEKHKTGEIVNLEFQIDRDCNGACLMCGLHNSTTWGKYKPELKEIGIDFYLENELDVAKYLKQIEKNVDYSQVSSILFLGGEPLRSNTHLKIIKDLQKVKSLDSVKVIYTTNGSIMPDEEILELWQQFKRVVIHVSIDGIEEHFDYLRWPLKWIQVESNLQKLLDVKNSNFKFTCSYGITPFNIFYHDRYVNWAQQFFADTSVDPDNFFAKPFAANGIMSPDAIPESLQQEIYIKYQNSVIGGHSVSKLLSRFNPNAYREFMNYIIAQDQLRGTNWKTVFPEIAHHFT